MQLECKTKRIFDIACLGKSFFIQKFAKCEILRILKIGLFHRVKELSKSSQTRYGSVKPKIFGIACLARKLGFHTETCEFCE